MKVQDIPFEPKYTKKAFEAAKNWLKTNVDKGAQFTSTTNYAIISDDGTVNPFFARPCHASIGSNSIKCRSLVATEIGQNRRKNIYKDYPNSKRSWDLCEPFLKWWLYKSYMGRFIVNRDDLEFIKTYGIIVSTDVSAPLLQCIMIVSRHFMEVQNPSFEKFNECVANGIDPALAYMCCFNTSVSGSTTFPAAHKVMSHVGHRAHPLGSLSSMKNYMNGEIGKVSLPRFKSSKEHYRKSINYVGGIKFFFDDESEASGGANTYTHKHFVYQLFLNEEFRAALSSYRGDGSTVMYRPPNPFTPKPTGGKPANDEVSYDELFKFVLPWCQEKGIFQNG